MKRRIEKALSALWRKDQLPRILYYHSVDERGDWSMKPRLFQSHVRWLRQEGYRSLTLRDAVRNLWEGVLEKRSVVITFDDGYEDNVLEALPILVQEGFAATFFVTSGYVGDRPEPAPGGARLYRDRKMMSKSQLRELADAGMEVGSHTRSHVNLREVLRDDPPRAVDEVKGSREELQDVLGRPVTSFAYPNGQRGVFSAATGELVRAAGYECAVTTMWGGLQPTSDMYELPRMEIRTEDRPETLARKLQGRHDFMALYCRWFDRSTRWGRADVERGESAAGPSSSRGE